MEGDSVNKQSAYLLMQETKYLKINQVIKAQIVVRIRAITMRANRKGENMVSIAMDVGGFRSGCCTIYLSVHDLLNKNKNYIIIQCELVHIPLQYRSITYTCIPHLPKLLSTLSFEVIKAFDKMDIFFQLHGIISVME